MPCMLVGTDARCDSAFVAFGFARYTTRWVPALPADASSQAASSVETGSVQLAAVKPKAAPQRSISAVAAHPAAEVSPHTAEQAAAGKTQAPPRRLVTAVREKAHEKVVVPFVPVTLVCKDLRYYVPGGCSMTS